MQKDIVYISDGNNLDLLNMSIDTFLRAYRGDDVSFHVLSTGADIKIDHAVNVLYPLDLLKRYGLDLSGIKRDLPVASLLRLALPYTPELVDCSRVLFVDTDVLIVDNYEYCKFSDVLSTLFTMRIDDAEIVMAPDHGWTQGRNAMLIETEIKRTSPELAGELACRIWDVRGTRFSSYGNGGFSLWNLDRIRYNGEGWFRKRLACLQKILTAGGFSFLDQDFSNTMMEAAVRMSGICNWISGRIGERCIGEHFAGFGNKGSIRSVYENLKQEKR